MMNLNKKLGGQTLPIRTMSISSSIGFPIDLVCILPALLNSESLQACKIFEMLNNPAAAPLCSFLHFQFWQEFVCLGRTGQLFANLFANPGHPWSSTTFARNC